MSRTLKRAAAILGGVEALAARLSAPVAEVTRWIAGIPPPPEAMVFIAALGIVSAGPLNSPNATRTRMPARKRRALPR